MKKIVLILLSLLASNVLAADTFDAATGNLTIESVVVGDTLFKNVEVKLKAFDLLKVGSSEPIDTVTAACTDANFSLDHFNAIAKGMSLAKVKQTIGCTFDPGLTIADGSQTRYAWHSENAQKIIVVIFDASGSFVVNDVLFKVRTGF